VPRSPPGGCGDSPQSRYEVVTGGSVRGRRARPHVAAPRGARASRRPRVAAPARRGAPPRPAAPARRGALLVRVPCALRCRTAALRGSTEPARQGREDNVERKARNRANSTLTALSAVNVELSPKTRSRSTFASPDRGKRHTNRPKWRACDVCAAERGKRHIPPKSGLACDVLLAPLPRTVRAPPQCRRSATQRAQNTRGTERRGVTCSARWRCRCRSQRGRNRWTARATGQRRAEQQAERPTGRCAVS